MIAEFGWIACLLLGAYLFYRDATKTHALTKELHQWQAKVVEKNTEITDVTQKVHNFQYDLRQARRERDEFAEQAARAASMDEVRGMMDKLPSILLHTITGSANNHKGALGELVGYLSLKAEYDRILPLGTIVDFVGIKFPTDDDPGKVDFIDVKTGKARLNKDQVRLKKLIEGKLIGFKKIRIDTSENFPQTD